MPKCEFSLKSSSLISWLCFCSFLWQTRKKTGYNFGAPLITVSLMNTCNIQYFWKLYFMFLLNIFTKYSQKCMWFWDLFLFFFSLRHQKSKLNREKGIRVENIKTHFDHKLKGSYRYYLLIFLVPYKRYSFWSNSITRNIARKSPPKV